ncbi:hypothetical protein [Frateuria defendens]|uniref:hypothetical protein n=1 Tax=Frateuria defendens TaxID=2219559 RepID=UPI00066FFE5F|nr:hypothetical protein [Frateuria defendens]
MTNITDNEARSLIYFAIGVASEGSDRAYQLAFAGNLRPDAHGIMKMYPAGNSGYTIGTLQTDLGQHKEVAGPLTDAFQAWARTTHADWILTETQRQQAMADLSRDGNTITAQHQRPMDATVKSHLDQFLASDAGVSFVHRHDMAQTERLMAKAVAPLRETKLFRNATVAELEKLIAITAKAFNQNEGIGGRILRQARHGNYRNVAEVSAAIDAFAKDMRDGRDNALHGTQLFRDLQQTTADHPLHRAWENTKANPLVDPTRLGDDLAHPQLPHEYAVIKQAFVDPAHARPMIHALSQGGSYAKSAHGRGFYAEGRRVPTVQALNTPMEQSGMQWQQAMQQFQQHQEQAQQRVQPIQEQSQAMQ